MTSRAVDLLRWPILGPILRWRHIRTVAQLALGLVALVIVVHGLFGPQLAPKNLATTLVWIHYRGLLIGALLAVGNVLCGACPIVLVRDVARRVRRPTHRWPRWLSIPWIGPTSIAPKWVALLLFAAILFSYERYDLWALPAATAWLVLGYFLAAVIVDTTFTGAAFCKHVCPVGQFNFIASTLSPMEVMVRDRDVCRSCHTADCIKGRRSVEPPATASSRSGWRLSARSFDRSHTGKAHVSSAARAGQQEPAGVIIQRGCELGLFLPTKVGNLDCTFCLDCVHACPHDNVAIGVRVPGDELVDNARRSSIGRLSARPDLAALALLFTFGALLNAFAMIGPAYVVEQKIAGLLGTTNETPVLAIIFVAGLIVIPLALCGAAAWLTRSAQSASRFTLHDTIVRYAYTLTPFGFGVWLAHYGFHFLTGAGTIVPVTQSAAIDLTGFAFLGNPDWRWLGMRPGAVFAVQLGVVMLGTMGALTLVQRVSERDHPAHARRASAPWIVLILALAGLALWMLSLPMEMRGTGLAG